LHNQNRKEDLFKQEKAHESDEYNDDFLSPSDTQHKNVAEKQQKSNSPSKHVVAEQPQQQPKSVKYQTNTNNTVTPAYSQQSNNTTNNTTNTSNNNTINSKNEQTNTSSHTSSHTTTHQKELKDFKNIIEQPKQTTTTQVNFINPSLLNNNLNNTNSTQDNFKSNEANTNINNMGMDQFKKEFEKISYKSNFDNFNNYNFSNKQQPTSNDNK